MAEVYNKTNIVHGSIKVTIASTLYILDDVTITRTYNKIDSPDELGSPARKALTVGDVNGTATAQLATGTTREPRGGDEFTYTFDAEHGAETFFIDSVERAMVAGQETKLNLTFDKNPTV